MDCLDFDECAGEKRGEPLSSNSFLLSIRGARSGRTQGTGRAADDADGAWTPSARNV